eukprot:2518837-Pyramimonas_sp.AAC.1
MARSSGAGCPGPHQRVSGRPGRPLCTARAGSRCSALSVHPVVCPLTDEVRFAGAGGAAQAGPRRGPDLEGPPPGHRPRLIYREWEPITDRERVYTGSGSQSQAGREYISSRPGQDGGSRASAEARRGAFAPVTRAGRSGERCRPRGTGGVRLRAGDLRSRKADSDRRIGCRGGGVDRERPW